MSQIITLETDGRTVWVNNSQSFCIGRFRHDVWEVFDPENKRLVGQYGRTNWIDFQLAMLKHHSADVPDDYKPRDAR